MAHRLTIRGQLDPETFVPWIRRHAAKIGLRQTVTFAGPHRIELAVEGADELVDMMEVGCLLGPIDAEVEGIDCAPEPSGLAGR